MKKRTIALLLAATLSLGLLSACGGQQGGSPSGNNGSNGSSSLPELDNKEPTPSGDPVYGGVLHVTINSDPTSLDPMITSSESDQMPATHIFETALAFDMGGDIWPGVCDFTFEDGILTMTVRDGVTFHDGSVCTIDDVYASLQRWFVNASAARKQVQNKAKSIEQVEDAIVITFDSAVPLALQTIAAYDQGLYVFPAAICEKYPDGSITDDADMIGTGPYKYVEHQADRYVLVERYDGYVPTKNDAATGMAAPKMAYCDQIYFHPVGDKTTRITGVQTGEYDVGVGVPANMIADMNADPNLTVLTTDLGIMAGLVFNNKSGPCADVNLRNAILATLDMEELMLAAQGDASLFRLNPSVMMTTSQWFVDESLGKYNNVDLDKAKEYLDASSYNGEKLAFITTSEYDYFYNTAILVAQMAGQIGIDIDVQVYDNATLKEYRDNPDRFDMFSSGLTAKLDPTQVAFMDSDWAGFWDSEEKDRLINAMSSSDDFNTRYQTWVELQKLIYTEVPNITFGERINPIVCRSNVHNLFETTQKYYWNTWKDAG